MNSECCLKIHNLSTTYPLSPSNRPKPTFCAPLPARQSVRTQRKQGIFRADTKNLRRVRVAGAHRSSVGNKC